MEGGIVAAFVPALKREYVWDAIYDRLTYGTTGARILVSLKINSAPMGSEVKAIGDAPVTIEGSVLGTDTVTVELLRDNQVIQTWACAAMPATSPWRTLPGAAPATTCASPRRTSTWPGPAPSGWDRA